MDALTHGLASYSLTRAIFPRATWATVIAAMLAGMAADVDELSRYGSAAGFLQWHRTYTHSIAGAVAIALIFGLVALLVTRSRATTDSPVSVFSLVAAACVLHLAMDAAQNEGVQLLWPVRKGRFSADWAAHFDLWILAVLLAGVLLPQLLGLVTEEIGAKSKGPRGRIGAAVALVVVGVYIGGRAILHSKAIAAMESRTYRGELPRNVAALAETDSPLHWHGLVETERAFHTFELDLSPGSAFNADAGAASYKPEASPALEAARNTDSARTFLQAARFPKASVEKTANGYHVEMRDLANQVEANSGQRVIAVIETDGGGRVQNDELIWRRW